MFRSIAESIVSGHLPLGRQLPTYATFEDLYEVGNGTVSRVMFALRMCGFVRGVPGGHTYVSDEWRSTLQERFEDKNV